jgi:hypothetical protein
MDCELAVANIVDRSGSMDSDGSSTPPLRRVKDALKAVAGLVPSGYWHAGIGAFPDSNAPIWGMELLTDGNRQALRTAIEGLSASGSSPILQGLFLGGVMVLPIQKRKVVVIASDGNVCGQTDCNDVRESANTLKSSGIAIVTFGINLSGAQRQLMEDIASAGQNGQKLFINSTGSAIYSALYDGLVRACDWREGFLIVPSEVVVAAGGSVTDGYQANWSFGNAFPASILAPPAGDVAQISLERTTGTLGATSPTFGGKMRITVPESATPGIAARPVYLHGPLGIVDSRSMQLRTVRLSMTPRVVRCQHAGNTISATMRIDLDASYPVQTSYSHIVTTPGLITSVNGFVVETSSFGNNASIGTSSHQTSFKITRTSAPPGRYDINFFVSGAGRVERFVMPNVKFPRLIWPGASSCPAA